MSRYLHIRVVLMLAVVLTGTRVAGAADDKSEARTGAFQIKIDERCKESAIPAVVSRLGWGGTDAIKNSGDEQDYDLANETFEVYVSAAYTGDEPYGLFVWVNPGDDGKPLQHWVKVLDKHKLIWIGANRSGNKRAGWVRLGLALDAAKYMTSAYRIDPDRVYVSGASGGGKCASMLGILWPDVFTGGSYPMIGLNFYRRVPVAAAGAGKGAEYYPQSFKRPPAKLWELAAKQRRHVFLTGDTDSNRQPTELTFKEAKKDGFKHLTYIQVPGMGHQAPDAEWFEKGIVALDDRSAPVVASAPAAEVKAAKPAPAQPKPRSAPVTAKPQDASDAASPDAEPEKLLKLARLYVQNRLYNKAREKLKQLVKDHPGTPEAREADKLLKEIGKG